MKFFYVVFLCINSIAYSQVLPDGITPEQINSAPTQQENGLPLTDYPQPVTTKKYQRKPIDLILFPETKKLILSAAYTNQSLNYEVDYYGEQFSKNESNSNQVDLNALYAFNEKFGAGLSFAQVTKDEFITEYGPGSNSDGTKVDFDSSGMKDPELTVLYRAMDVSRDRYDMNIGAIISPELQDSKYATGNKDGNAAKGRDEYSIFLKWGRRNPNYSWAVGLQLDFFGDGKSKSASSGDTAKTSSYSSAEFTSDFQWMVSSAFSIELNLSYFSLGDFTYTYDDGSKAKWDPAVGFTIGTTANILIYEQTYIRLVLNGGSVSPRDVEFENGDIVTQEYLVSGKFSAGIIRQF